MGYKRLFILQIVGDTSVSVSTNNTCSIVKTKFCDRRPIFEVRIKFLKGESLEEKESYKNFIEVKWKGND